MKNKVLLMIIKSNKIDFNKLEKANNLIKKIVQYMKRKSFYEKGNIVYCVIKNELCYNVSECMVLSDSDADSKCINVEDVDFSYLEYCVGRELVFINEKDAYLQAIKMNDFARKCIKQL